MDLRKGQKQVKKATTTKIKNKFVEKGNLIGFLSNNFYNLNLWLCFISGLLQLMPCNSTTSAMYPTL